MDIKERIQKSLSATLPDTRVALVKSAKGRLIVYAVSKAFADRDHLERQRVIDDALTGPQSQITRDEYRTIALVRPFSPSEFRGFLKERWARAKKQKPAEPTS